MTNSEQLKKLLKNAIEEGFTVEDIESLAEDAEREQIQEDTLEAIVDEYQEDAANAFADFLFSIDYFDDEDVTHDDVVSSMYDSLQLVREGKLNFVTKKSDNGYSFYSKYTDSDFDKIIKWLKNI